MKPVRILVVNDHSCVRAGLCSLLEDTEGFEVAGETDSTSDEDMTNLIARCCPDLIVLDIDAAPEGRGFTVLERLAQRGYRGRVIVLSLRDGPTLRARAEACGAGAFLDKGIAPDDLVEVLRAVARRFIADALDDPPLPPPRPARAPTSAVRRAA